MRRGTRCINRVDIDMATEGKGQDLTPERLTPEQRARPDTGNCTGNCVESAVGAHLLNTAPPGMQITYWRDRNQEVGFVISHGKKIIAVEVKSGRAKGVLTGLQNFAARFSAIPLLVGTGGIPLKTFLETPVAQWVGVDLGR